MEKLLKKEFKYQCNDEFHKSLDTLKQKMVTISILVFPNWSQEFHVHVDASLIALGTVLAQPCEGELSSTE